LRESKSEPHKNDQWSGIDAHFADRLLDLFATPPTTRRDWRVQALMPPFRLMK
jgi:hypothetical protein